MGDANTAEPGRPILPVVLIEDDEFIAAALKDLLEFHGYSVQTASTLRQANSALSGLSGRCLVLLDPLVPGVTPASVLGALKDDQALITIAMAVYPAGTHRGDPPSTRKQSRRLISPDLLLEMVRDAFSEGARAEAPPTRARRCVA